MDPKFLAVPFRQFLVGYRSARTGRAQPAARERCDRNSKHPDCLRGRRHSTLRRGLCGRSHPPCPEAAPRYCQKHAKSAGSHRHHVPVFHAVSVPHTGGRSPYTPAAFHKFTKNHKARISQAIPQPMPGRFPHASDPHTDNIPIPPQSDHAPAETSAPAYANQAPTGLHKLPAAATACSPPTASTHDVASRRGDEEGPAFKPARRPAPAAQGADPRGIWTGWIQQKSADAAPDLQDE